MSDLDPLFPRHANSGPAPEVTPPERMSLLEQLFGRILDDEPEDSSTFTLTPSEVAALLHGDDS